MLMVQMDANLGDILQQMSLHRSSCVLVVENQQLVGILTERDVVRAVAKKLAIETLPISALMSRQVITLAESEADNLFAVIEQFRRYGIRHLPILNADHQVIEVATLESVRQKLQPSDLLRMRRVQEVMQTQVVCADRAMSVEQLAQLMATHSISCVVIVDEPVTQSVSLLAPRSVSAKFPVGIVTERDIVQSRSLHLNLAKIAAAELMSAPLFPIRASDTLWQAHQDMQSHHIRRLVVMGADEELVGIVTQTDILKTLDPLELSEVIQSLRRLVHQRDQEIEQGHRQRQQIEKALATMTAETTALQRENAALVQQNAKLEQKLRDVQMTERTTTRCDIKDSSDRFRLRRLHRVIYEVQGSLSNINMAMQMTEIMLRQFGVLRKLSASIAPYFKVIQEECQQSIQLLNEVDAPIDATERSLQDDSHLI